MFSTSSFLSFILVICTNILFGWKNMSRYYRFLFHSNCIKKKPDICKILNIIEYLMNLAWFFSSSYSWKSNKKSLNLKKNNIRYSGVVCSPSNWIWICIFQQTLCLTESLGFPLPNSGMLIYDQNVLKMNKMRWSSPI